MLPAPNKVSELEILYGGRTFKRLKQMKKFLELLY